MRFRPVVFFIIFCFIFLLNSILFVCCEEDACYNDKFSDEPSESSCENRKHADHYRKNKNIARDRYLLYEVNPGEGFNLRRDVYMRVATLVKKLNEDAEFQRWILVLPPWGPLYHWKSKAIGFQAQIKWSTFFDIPNLAQYVPVVEFGDFLKDHGTEIDVIYYLQHYAEGFDEKWEEKADIRECIDGTPYSTTEKGEYVGWFWGFDDVLAKEFYCLSIQGYSSTLKKFISSSKAKSIMIDRAEVILHDSFGDFEYWKVRKSMVFSKDLIEIGDDFRRQFLNSSDKSDLTPKRSFDNNALHRSALGGPYIGVHLRRQDFVHSRSKDVPSIRHAADQISKLMDKLGLSLVYLATDAPNSEFKEFQQYIPSVVRFVPDGNLHKKILDGGVAIVDQWICSHARYFIGTYESTFSFRIQEEREILGFPVDMTFNRLCGDNQTSCKQPSKWTLVNS